MLKIFIALIASAVFVGCDEYETNVKFVLFNKGHSSMSSFNRSIAEEGCDVGGNFSIILHGWMGSSGQWIPDLVGNLTQQRAGCVIFMNFSRYSDKLNYFEVIQHFQPLAQLLTRKLRQLSVDGASSDKMFIFGFSFGGRIAVEAALNFGPKRIAQIDSENRFFRP